MGIHIIGIIGVIILNIIILGLVIRWYKNKMLSQYNSFLNCYDNMRFRKQQEFKRWLQVQYLYTKKEKSVSK